MGWINIAIGVVLLALALINPRSLWHATTGWRYRDPDANEPSEDALFLGRVGRALMGVLSILLGIYVNGGFDHSTDPRAAAEQVAAAVRAAGPVNVSSYDDDGSEFESRLDRRMESALEEARSSAELGIDNVTRGAGYTDLTLWDGEKARFCLTVTETGRSAAGSDVAVAVDVTLTDGGCRSRRYSSPAGW